MAFIVPLHIYMFFNVNQHHLWIHNSYSLSWCVAATGIRLVLSKHTLPVFFHVTISRADLYATFVDILYPFPRWSYTRSPKWRVIRQVTRDGFIWFALSCLHNIGGGQINVFYDFTKLCLFMSPVYQLKLQRKLHLLDWW